MYEYVYCIRTKYFVSYEVQIQYVVALSHSTVSVYLSHVNAPFAPLSVCPVLLAKASRHQSSLLCNHTPQSLQPISGAPAATSAGGRREGVEEEVSDLACMLPSAPRQRGHRRSEPAKGSSQGLQENGEKRGKDEDVR
jgi:hypothetical protein